MKTIFTFLFFITTILLNAQQVEVVHRADTAFFNDTDEFAFIESGSDITDFHYVATLQSTHKKIESVFFAIKQKAISLGANAFKMKQYDTSNNKHTILMEVYHAADSVLDYNFDLHEKNVVYLFAAERKAEAFKIGKKKYNLKNGAFLKYELQQNEEIKINKGGLLGMTLWVKWKKDRPATFLGFSGVGLEPGSPYNTIGVTMNTGRINYIQGDLGHLLVAIKSGLKSEN